MNTSLCKLSVAALFAASLVTASAALKVGDAFPDLAGFKLEGRLPEPLKGKVVVLDFWASWCQPCAESFPIMDELQKKYGDRVVFIAVNVDDKVAKMEAFLKKHPVSFTVVRNPEQTLISTVSPETLPTSFILDAGSRVRFLHNGFHGAETRQQYITEIESLLK